MTADREPRDAGSWARPTSALHVGEVPEGAVNLVEGKRLAGLTGGFGKMWQKTYRMRLSGAEVTPQQVIASWKDGFPSFWPEGANFYGPLTGIAPGDAALLNLKMPGGVTMSTGVLVLYADDESFSFMTPEGHMFASMITFSSEESEGQSVVQISILLRASDPVYELAMALGGHRKEDRFWVDTLTNLASHFGVEDAEIDLSKTCVDRKRQWRNARNIRQNAAIRSGMYAMGAPVRWIGKPFRRRAKTGA